MRIKAVNAIKYNGTYYGAGHKEKYFECEDNEANRLIACGAAVKPNSADDHLDEYKKAIKQQAIDNNEAIKPEEKQKVSEEEAKHKKKELDAKQENAKRALDKKK